MVHLLRNVDYLAQSCVRRTGSLEVPGIPHFGSECVQVPARITHLYTSTECLSLLIGQAVELVRILRRYVRTGVEVTRRSALTIAAQESATEVRRRKASRLQTQCEQAAAL